jgi:hypothetical protein
MFNILKFFGHGRKDSILFKSNGALSHNGPWKQIYPDTLLDRWHVGEFSSAEYTISVDIDNNDRELVKCLITAGLDVASVVIYGRSNLGRNLVEITATVNNSYVDVVLNPANEDSTPTDGAKVIYTVQYFQNQNPLIV